MLLALASLAASSARATDGYFDHGYGVKAKGIGGAGVAFPQDALAPATNPAGAAFIADRLDLGLSYFQPDRSSSLGGTDYQANQTESFLIPELGLKTSLSANLAFDLAIYGNGGMNTDYATAIPGFGTTPAGIDLSQLFIAPTLAYKLNDNHALGFAPILAYQRFKATGLESFGVANAGYDSSYGAGLRLGYTGKLASWLTIGATYQSRVLATEFDSYKGLFAERGGFDIPSNFALGFALHPHERLTFAFDVEHIFYSEVNSVGNKLTFPRLGNGLGSDEGPGFGWRDVTAIKTGIAFEATESLTLRVGYNHSTQPVRQNQTYFNILAPGVVQDHATAGFTWKYNANWELSGFYTHAFENGVNGSGNAFGPPTDADLRMSQDTFGLSLGWLF
jgi:long-chain fatty acid transport protein